MGLVPVASMQFRECGVSKCRFSFMETTTSLVRPPWFNLNYSLSARHNLEMGWGHLTDTPRVISWIRIIITN